ncbi:pre-60S factor rei1 [Linderina pennispora]|nr:pre-60S factor rei1 [Linderina pennispora]
MNAQSSPLFTCMACQVAFYSAEQQRLHYRTDWHRYNLKRKVVGLPSVTAENFAQRVLAQQAKAADDSQRASFSATCDVCKKTYSSENAFNNHLNSKKHKEAERKMVQKIQDEEIQKMDQEQEVVEESAPKVSEFVISDDEDEDEDEEVVEQKMDVDAPLSKEDVERERRKQERQIKHQLNTATTEQEVIDLLEKKKKAAPRLNPDHDCLFCPHQSDMFEQNMEHMAKAHSLFIPDLEYLVDLHGLIQYLANKISIANVCLYCSGRGRALQSLEAVRQHMLDKGHCKIAYEEEIDVLEISDFYDFSSTYPDADQHDKDEELDEEAMAGRRSLMGSVEEEDGELVLPSGERIGHRTLRRYYKQTIPMLRTEKDSVMIHKMLTNYAENPEYQNQIVQTSHNRELVMAQPHGRQAWKDMATFKEYRQRHDYKTAIGMRNNGLMKHFRQQNPF